MANKVTFDYSKAAPFVQEHEVELMKKLALDAKEVLVSKSGAGNDFLGWIDLPVDYDKEEFSRIKKAAEKIQNGEIDLDLLESTENTADAVAHLCSVKGIGPKVACCALLFGFACGDPAGYKRNKRAYQQRENKPPYFMHREYKG